MAKYAHYGWWSTAASAPRGFGGDTNQYAAMPSLHVGWAVWCGWQLVQYGEHRITRVLGVLYPLVLSIVVIATANHYLLDVLAGVAVLLLAWVSPGCWPRRWPTWRRAGISPPSCREPG